MNYTEFRKIIDSTPETQGLEYKLAALWLHPQFLPLCVTSLGGCSDKVIRIPARAVNKYSNEVSVTAIGSGAFAGNTAVTDIILSSKISRIGEGAFSGCSSLERITIPKSVKQISRRTFEGCSSLKDIYYEGTHEEWERIEKNTETREFEFGELIPGTPVQKLTAERFIRIPGNEALVLANLHFRCELPE